MKVTDVRIELSGETKVLAYCTVTIDNCFVIKDVKVIDGEQGLFICMPCKKIQRACKFCRAKNILTANYCNECGQKLAKEYIDKLYSDICHPLTNDCRMYIQRAVLREYEIAIADGIGCATSERVRAQFDEGL